MSKYYYHGTDQNSFFKILETGEIKCRRLIEEENINITRTIDKTIGPGSNGYEYISLCNKNDFYDSEDAYNTFIKNSYCFIISDEIEAIKTINMNDRTIMSKYGDEFHYFVNHNSDSEIRFSIMRDEYQVKTKIPLSKIVGFGFPFKRVNKKQLDYLFSISYKFKLDVVDTTDPYFIERYENFKSCQKAKRLKKII